MKLNRARCTTAARSRCMSVPKKIEDALEGGYQPSVLRPTLLHTE
jgi:hypothetical protein